MLLENIDHHTESRPFSIHRTVVGEEIGNALYMHCHPEAELFYLRAGKLNFSVEDREYAMNAGDAIFIPAYLVHHAVKKRQELCDYSAVVFSEKWLLGYRETEGNLYTKALQTNRNDCVYVMRKGRESDRELLERISGFEKYRELPIESYELRLLGELLICFQELYTNHFSCIGIQDEQAVSRAGIQQSLDYMNAHYMDSMTLREIAGRSGYSPGHFGHRFKELTGYAPFEYLNRIRVIKASEALVLSREHVTVIAGECGFNNISYFNRVFCKMMGMSPTEYRRTHSRM